MSKQITDWGSITWLEEEADFFSVQGLKAGIVSFLPGVHQPKHIHYEEQVVYVIRGQAISILDGVESCLSPGGFFHWKSGVEHEMYNTGEIPFEHLLISNPVVDELDSIIFPGEKEAGIYPGLIYTAVEAIRTQFLESLHYGYAIFDSLGNLILQSQFYPEYCVKCCQPGDHQGSCLCMGQLPLADCEKERTLHCTYGMEIFHYPIFFRGTFLGYIQSGYIRHSTDQKGAIEHVYDAPESMVAGIKALLRRIVKAIRNYCEFEQFRKELTDKELHIASQEEKQRILLKNLKDTEYAMTDLKISNHFLFNTLNSMASMALDEGSMALYQSIVDLSKMFHYTLRTQASMVPVEKEIGYVKAYLQLQKLRYGDSLTVNYRIDSKVQGILVPFNFLQPVVENAFIHGFHDCEKKRVDLVIGLEEERIVIKVINSGLSLTEQACCTINHGIRSSTSHGLSMLYQKLEAVYGRDVGFEIGTRDGDTCFTIDIPGRSI